MRIVDLSSPTPWQHDVGDGLLLVTGSAADIAAPANQRCVQRATVTLSQDDSVDGRVVTVDSTAEALAELSHRIATWPQAAAVCDDVLRAVDPVAPTRAGVITESLAYSTLQAGEEFARWLRQRGPAQMPQIENPVLADRDGDTLHVRFNRPSRHNAFSTDARAALLEALDVARYDTSIDEVILSGNGLSFCSGGDLAEFGSFADPASAHLARTRHSPALALSELTDRLSERCVARLHGQVLGSGLEMAAFCGSVVAQPDCVIGLPELSLGLLPGAGGTVSVTRRIGRWRTAYLVLSGRTIDAATALKWGLVDAIG